MKKLAYSFGFVGLFLSCGAPADETTTETKDTTTQVVVPEVVEPEIVNSFLLESGVVGIFKIGQPIPVLPAELNTRKSTVMVDEDGAQVEHVQHIVFNSLEDVAEITMEKNDEAHEADLAVISMRVISNYYETKDAIKVGTTLTQLMEKYPDTKLWYNGANSEIVAETPAYISVQFIINSDGCTKALKGTKNINLSKSNFNEEAKISSIRVN